MARRILAVAVGALALAITASAPSAAADGLPVPGWIAPTGGVPGPYGGHYTTREENGRTTITERSAGGTELQSRTVQGAFTAPAVAFDGSPAGLSADASTLALTAPRHGFPQKRTHLLLLNADGLAVRSRITLQGDFGFDAISPDGSRLYFIQYLSGQDPSRYAVRAYDASSGELLADPIVDPNEEDPGEMRGRPITRASSPDGRWAYTFYDDGGAHPFIHALDTAEGRAVCIDTPMLAHARDLYVMGLRVSSDGSTVTVSDRGRPVALVDTQTFAVRGPSAPAPAPDTGSGDLWRLAVPATAVMALAGAALVLIARRRHGGLAPGDA